LAFFSPLLTLVTVSYAYLVVNQWECETRVTSFNHARTIGVNQFWP